MDFKIFNLNKNDKRVQWLLTSWLRMIIVPIIDTIVLMLVFPTVMFLLNEYSGKDYVMFGEKVAWYIYAGIVYITICVVVAIYDFFKYIKLNNTVIIKKDNEVIFTKQNSFLRVSNDNVSKNDINSILKSLEDNVNNFKYKKYDNCEMIKETRKYYKYSGFKDDKLCTFKIYKIYKEDSDFNYKGIGSTRKIILMSLCVYFFAFSWLFINSSVDGVKCNSVKEKYVSYVENLVYSCGYTEENPMPLYDVSYLKDKDVIDIKYFSNLEETKTQKIRVEFNLNFNEDLNEVYKLIDGLHEENMSKYQNEIERLIEDFKISGDKQSYNNVYEYGQVVIYVENSDTKDFLLEFAINSFNTIK